jgi:hypothetical protein
MSEDVGGGDRRVPPGPATRYKGGRYVVLGRGQHTETGKASVVYRSAGAMPPEVDFWVRPEDMFVEQVMHDGLRVPRFDTTTRRSQPRPDILAAVEDTLDDQLKGPGQMTAVRALIDAQRTQAIELLEQQSDGADPDNLRGAVARMLQLLDAAEREVEEAESAHR